MRTVKLTWLMDSCTSRLLDGRETVKLGCLRDGCVSRLLHERELVRGRAGDQVAGQDWGHQASRENV